MIHYLCAIYKYTLLACIAFPLLTGFPDKRPQQPTHAGKARKETRVDYARAKRMRTKTITNETAVPPTTPKTADAAAAATALNT